MALDNQDGGGPAGTGGESSQEGAPGNAPAGSAPAPSRPDFLSDKFKTVEDQARAYRDAERMISRLGPAAKQWEKYAPHQAKLDKFLAIDSQPAQAPKPQFFDPRKLWQEAADDPSVLARYVWEQNQANIDAMKKELREEFRGMSKPMAERQNELYLENFRKANPDFDQHAAKVLELMEEGLSLERAYRHAVLEAGAAAAGAARQKQEQAAGRSSLPAGSGAPAGQPSGAKGRGAKKDEFWEAHAEAQRDLAGGRT